MSPPGSLGPTIDMLHNFKGQTDSHNNMNIRLHTDLSPNNAALLSMNKNMAMTENISDNFLPYDF